MKVWKLMISQGKEPPPEYYERPELDPALLYLHEAFYDLTTERHYSMAGVGPIPHSKIKEYGRDELDLTGSVLERFIRTIGEIDSEYLSLSHKPTDEPLREIKPKNKKPKKPLRPLKGRR